MLSLYRIENGLDGEIWGHLKGECEHENLIYAVCTIRGGDIQ